MQHLWFFLFAMCVAVGCQSDDSGSNDGADGDNEMSAAELNEGNDDGEAGSGGEQAAGAGSEEPGDAAGLDCPTMCGLLIEPACEGGPPSQNLCEVLCESMLGSENEMCRTAFENIMACLDPSAEFTCNADDIPYPDTCQTEYEATLPCLPTL